MIKAVGEKDGKPMYIFGLSQGNWENLLRGRPIVIDLDVLTKDIPKDAFANGIGTVMLTGGTTERSIIRMLRQHVDLPEPTADKDMP